MNSVLTSLKNSRKIEWCLNFEALILSLLFGVILIQNSRPREAVTKHVSRMPSYETLRRVALVRTDVLEEHSASIIRVTRIGELELLVTANIILSSPILVTLRMELSSSKTLVLTRATRRNVSYDDILDTRATGLNIPDDGIIHSHRRKNLKSYKEFIIFL
jgi:hypothetical protein